jgi:hypothetical protein
MRRFQFSKLVVLLLTVSISACAAVQAERQAQEAKKQEFVQRVDISHIWITEGDAPPGKPYQVLGDISYSEPFSPDAIDAHKMNQRLKDMAYQKYPEDIDALIKVKSDVSSDGSQVTVSAQAIKYEQSADREAMHKMNEGMVASPSGN